jgi:subtilisin family serine protease
LSSVVSLLAVVAALTVALVVPQARSSTTSTYLVVYNGANISKTAVSSIKNAGGTVVASYRVIGVMVARSDNSSFASNLKQREKNLQGVVATDTFGVGLSDTESATDGADQAQGPTTTQAWGDTLSNRQWDMTQISVPEAHEVTQGSPSVVVGDIDTGLDFTHPDIAPNYDASRSADCTSGAPAPLAVGNDQSGHGTHTAGTIAAAANGIGIVGVAPSVKIAGIKSSTDDGFFFPEMVVCSFMWAATHGISVTNNSYFADPFLFNCKNDPTQRAIWNAERRAISYAISKGVVVVAAMGNESDDISHPQVDLISPDFPPDTNIERTVTNACAIVPVEVAGVVGVTADGNRVQKSFYSSYGISEAAVIAPGGDSIYFDASTDVPNGRVLSTYPPYLFCRRPVVDPTGATYCYLQGTSMASPHVAGVAALIKSIGVSSPGAVTGRLESTADPLACPDPYQPSLDGFLRPSGDPQVCQGGISDNSFNGHGQVNALRAVS